MAPMSSTDPGSDGGTGRGDADPTAHGELLRRLAWDSIHHGLRHGRPLEPRPEDYPEALRAPGASFVTLERGGRLRGCIGSLEARRPLVVDVAHNAFSAAFQDPRFPPLQPSELDGLDLHISILTPPEPLPVTSEEDLLARIEPGRDGLILEEGPHRGTFLPAVWEQLPDPRQFVRHLKMKAGLPPDYWSPQIRVSRYRTRVID